MKQIFISCLFFCFYQAYSQTSNQKFSASGIPQLFLPGVISNGLGNRDMAISPSYNELYFTLQLGTVSAILYCKKQGNGWSKPEVAWFSGKFGDLEPAFSSDGNKLFFASNRPLNEKDATLKDYDIWYVEKKGGEMDRAF